jgi:hypothetical protein
MRNGLRSSNTRTRGGPTAHRGGGVLTARRVRQRRAASWRPAIADNAYGAQRPRYPATRTLSGYHGTCLTGAVSSVGDVLSRLRQMAAVKHSEKRTLTVSIPPRLRKADGGGHKRLRPMAAVFGVNTTAGHLGVLSDHFGGWERHHEWFGATRGAWRECSDDEPSCILP